MRPWVPVAGWAALLGVWTAVELIFHPQLIAVALLGGTAVAAGLLALVVTRPPRGEGRRGPELSPCTVVFTAGLAGVVTGFELGTWSIALGGLVAIAGLACLLRERT